MRSLRHLVLRSPREPSVSKDGRKRPSRELPSFETALRYGELGLARGVRCN
jgi:hypothetical protein